MPGESTTGCSIVRTPVRSPRRALAVAALWLLAIVSGGRLATAQPQQDPQIGALEARIASLEAELDRLGTARADVVREFEAVDIQLTLRRRQLAVLERRSELLEAEQTRQSETAVRLTSELAVTREDMRLRAIALYRIGPLSYARLLLSAKTPDHVLVGYQLVTYLAARDRDLVARVDNNLAALGNTLVVLETTRAQLEAVSAETRAAAEALDGEQEQRRQVLRRLDREAEAHRSSIAAASRSARELENTLGELVEESGATTTPTAATFAGSRGSLPWPVDGAVVGTFGQRRHPVYDTITVSRGLEIEAAAGDPVQAVFAGRVAFADWYSGYGLLVILDHGDGYFTLYGHLESTDVRVTDLVSVGEVVGRAGDTGSLTGPNLYFEVREGTDALNPVRWLRPR